VKRICFPDASFHESRVPIGMSGRKRGRDCTEYQSHGTKVKAMGGEEKEPEEVNLLADARLGLSQQDGGEARKRKLSDAVEAREPFRGMDGFLSLNLPDKALRHSPSPHHLIFPSSGGW
jgi:hypothetical protein